MEKATTVFTNERLSKKFKSSFELVNYAIHLAEDRIRAGRDIHEVNNENLVISVVKDLVSGKEILVPIVVVKEKIEALKADRPNDAVRHHDGASADKPKKGKRKIIRDEDEE